MTALKWAGDSRNLIEGMLAPYGGPVKGRDLHGEFFSTKTDFALGWFGDWERPLLYNHGLDGTIKTDVVGRIKVEQTDKGLWMQAQLDQAHSYYDEIASLVDGGALGLSSGSVGHLVRKDTKTGEIKSWPVIEGSMTPTPANPDARAGYAMKAADAVAHLTVLGIEAPDAVKQSAAADDVSEASMVRGCLTQLLADETGEGDQETILRRAIALIDRFISAETAEIGTEGDAAEPATDAAYLSLHLTKALTPQSLHDAAIASGAKCAGETPESEPAPLLAIAGKSAETPPAVDLEALKARLSEEAVKQARALIGR